MAEVNAKDLTTKTTPASTDSMLLFGTTSNEGAKITVDNLADNILGRLTTKTFANQVGGSSAATLLAQLSTLNSNKSDCVAVYYNAITINSGYFQLTCPSGYSADNCSALFQEYYNSETGAIWGEYSYTLQPSFSKINVYVRKFSNKTLPPDGTTVRGVALFVKNL